MTTSEPVRRSSARRYVVLLVVVALLIGGWSAFWYVAAGKAQTALEGWRAREAKSGRLYECGKESVGGYPFRFEFRCWNATALFQNARPPIEAKVGRVTVVSQVYQPTLLISEFEGPLTVAAPGKPPELTMNWELFQSSVRGTPAAPERASLVFDKPTLDAVNGADSRPLLRAEHLELHGRLLAGLVSDHPVLEVAVRTRGAFVPGIPALAAQPVDAVFDTVFRGLSDFAPKPWSERFREIAANNGRIEITESRAVQGETLAVGAGNLSISASGRLQGQLELTIAGLEPFLKSINAEQMVQSAPSVDRLASALDRLSPGLGQAAKQQVGANLSAGINMLGRKTTLEGRPAVALPLRFDDGRVFLGPIPLGETPSLF
ncbi:MAG: DUF2125 domain-containing protein [Proteobacteria bacterium]|nr:DUF2125 domain-containing protein [Pseudomonadota bacterium]